MVLDQLRPPYQELLAIHLLLIGADQCLGRWQMRIFAMDTLVVSLASCFPQFDYAAHPKQLAAPKGLVFVTLQKEFLKPGLVSLRDVHRNRQGNMPVLDCAKQTLFTVFQKIDNSSDITGSDIYFL